MKENKLARETSPYLKQHSTNPVNWYPWSEDAFAKARKNNQPIFLSIGYSTCHWCHVMAHESFEDQEIADILNKDFISIKVDREERPDIDSVYMQIGHEMNGRGGWPLTILMTPEKIPFFAGTYLPKESQGRYMGLMDLLEKTVLLWKDNSTQIKSQGSRFIESIKRAKSSEEKTPLISVEHLGKKCFHQLTSMTDPLWGGVGNQVKFPIASNILFLLEYYKKNPSEKLKKIITNHLNKMRLGGIWDHIGNGFHRYSTDREWKIPHFEKMLYDQAQLLWVYSEAWNIFKNPIYKDTCEQIVDFLSREMKNSDGGYFSALDADSEGKEGTYYVWTKKEIQEALSEEEFLFLEKHFEISDRGNFHEFPGKIVFFQNHEYDCSSWELFQKEFQPIQIKLHLVRKKRIYPHRDEKILADWNGLILGALSHSARIFNNDMFRQQAISCGEFIVSQLISDKGISHSLYGPTSKMGFLDDYSFTIWGFLRLYELTGTKKYFVNAEHLQTILDKEFADSPNGGYFFTSSKGEEVLFREKINYDGAIPSGQAITLLNLQDFYLLSGKKEIQDQINLLLGWNMKTLQEFPSQHALWIAGLLQQENTIKIQMGSEIPSDFQKDIQQIGEEYPQWNFLLSYGESSLNNGEVIICADKQCFPPVKKIIELREILKSIK